MVWVLLLWNLERMKYRRGIVNLLVARNYHSRHEGQRVANMFLISQPLTVLNASIMGVLSVDSSVFFYKEDPGLKEEADTHARTSEFFGLHTRSRQLQVNNFYFDGELQLHYYDELQFHQCGEGKHRY